MIREDGSLLIMLAVLLSGLVGLAIMVRSYRELRTAILFDDERLGVGALLGFFIGVGFVVVPVLTAASL